MGENTRQHYSLATGKGLDAAPPKGGSKFKKGGSVKSKNSKPMPRTAGKRGC